MDLELYDSGPEVFTARSLIQFPGLMGSGLVVSDSGKLQHFFRPLSTAVTACHTAVAVQPIESKSCAVRIFKKTKKHLKWRTG